MSDHDHDLDECEYDHRCPKCADDGPPDSALDRELAKDRREHPEWFDPFD